MTPPAPDLATVYFIRKSAFAGAATGWPVFVDDEYLGSLRSGTYLYTFVKEGMRVFPAAPMPYQTLVGGQTYYFLPMEGYARVSRQAADARIGHGLKLVTVSPKKKEKRAKSARGVLEAAMKRMERARADGQLLLPSRTPAPRDPDEPVAQGYVRAPTRTAIPIRSLHNIWTDQSQVGEVNWFEVDGDFVVGGSLVLPAGHRLEGVTTFRGAPGSFGAQSAVLVSIPAFTDGAGRHIPLWSHIEISGTNRSGAAMWTEAIAGPFSSAFVAGRHALSLAGEEFIVFTEGEHWILPVRSDITDTARPHGIRALRGRLKRATVKISPEKGLKPEYLEFDPESWEGDAPVRVESMRIVAVDGTLLPLATGVEQKISKAVNRRVAGTRRKTRTGIFFDAWQAIRWVRLERATSEVTLTFSAEDLEGRSYDIEAPLTIRLADG